MPLPAFMVMKSPRCPCMLVGANAASCPEVIKPAATPDEPLSEMVPVVAVKDIEKALTVKPRSIVRLRPAVSVRLKPFRFRVLAVPNEVATKRSFVAAREILAFWVAKRLGLNQDTVAPLGAWLAAMVGRSPTTTV